MEERAGRLVEALGGPDNIRSVLACALRIRVEVRDPHIVDEDAVRGPTTLGVVRSGTVVQVVEGPSSDRLAARMLDLLPTE